LVVERLSRQRVTRGAHGVDSQFTEFSFGFALTREIIDNSAFPILAAPELPSLIEEGGQGGGYDVALNFGTLLFLQFKLSEYMVGVAAGEAHVIGVPYYRFSLMQTWQSAQHALLLDLEGSGEEVYYAAPEFWTQEQFNTAFLAPAVAANSIFVAPSWIGQVDDEDSHRVVFNQHAAHFLSEPRKVRALRGRQFLDQVLGRLGSDGRDLRDVAKRMDEIVRRRGFRTPGLRSLERPSDVFRFVSFLAHAFFHCEVLFIPVS
jgi:hypothetical protein